MKGNIKFYNRDRRFGFITADDGKDYFFHESGLEPGTRVRDDDRVSFEVVEGDRGPKAEHVKIVTDDESSAEPAAEDTTEEASEEPSEETNEEEASEAASEEEIKKAATE